ncbi:tape measure protein [Sphingobacterium sp. 1.A.4]|uniref:tape measure protein n=1 Tax=Sphingobacterium sp. 1.A.4 TaxID=2044603 RepID=UPI000C0BFA8B|nr:tape measure protein [Sphingobacterium sp. 1.A.4]
MAIKVIDGGLVIKAILDATEAKKEAKGLADELESLTNVKVSPDKQYQLRFIESIRQARLEAAKSRAEYESLSATYVRGEIDAQQYRQEILKLNQQRKEEARQAREVKKALLENSAYKQLDNELKSLRGASKDLLAEMVKLERQGLKNTQAYRALSNEANRLTKETNVLDRQMKSIDASVGQHYRNVGNYGDAISMVAPQISQFAGRLGLLAAGVAAVGQSFSSNLRLEPVERALQVVSGSTDEFNKNLEFLRETSDRLGLNFIASAESFKLWQGSARLSNLTADESRKIFESVANASAKMKLSNEQVQGTFLALSQMMSKGKVQAEELRGQLGERIPGAFEMAAEAMGVTTAELNKMLEKGEVIAQDFLPRFADQLDKTFGNDKNERIQGMSASIERLKNNFEALWQSEKATKFFTAVTDGLSGLLSEANRLIGSNSWKELWRRLGEYGQSAGGQLMTVEDFRNQFLSTKEFTGNRATPKRNEYYSKISKKEFDEELKLAKDHAKKMEKASTNFQAAVLNNRINGSKTMVSQYKQQESLTKLHLSRLERIGRDRGFIAIPKFVAPEKNTSDKTTTTSKNNSSAERAAERIKRENDAEEKARQQQLQEQSDFQKKISDIKESIRRDSLSKEEQDILKIRDRYVELWKEAEEKRAKGLKVDTSDLKQLEQTEIDKFYENKRKEEKKKEEDKYKELIDTLITYEGKREKILKEHDAKRTQLTAKGNFEEAHQLDLKTTEELNALDDANIQKLQSYRDLFEGVEKLTDASARKVLKSAKDELLGITNISPELRKKIEEVIRDTTKAIDNRLPQRISLMSDAFSEMAGSVSNVNEELSSMLQGVSNLLRSITQIKSGFDDLKSALKNYTEQKNSGEGGLLGSISAIAGIGGAVGQVVGAVARVVGGIVGFFKQAKESARKAREEMEIYHASVIAGEKEYKQLLRERARDQENINELTNKELETRKQILSLQGGDSNKDFLSLLREIQKSGQQITGQKTEKYGGFLGIGKKTRVVDVTAGLAGYTYEELERLYTSNKLTEATKKQFEQLQKLKGEVDDIAKEWDNAQEILKDRMSGNISSDSLLNNLKNNLREGKRAIEDFGDDIEGIIQDALLSGMAYQYLNEPLKKLVDQFRKDSLDGLDEKEIANFKDGYEAIVKTGIDLAKKAEDILGNPIGTATSSNAGVSGRVNPSIKETTASEILAFERSRYEIATKQLGVSDKLLVVANDNLIALNSIQVNTANTVERLDRAVVELQAINRNTSPQSTRQYTG